MNTPKNDLIGRAFGKLTALSIVKDKVSGKHRRTIWLCRCECGKEREVNRDSLTSGGTTTCGSTLCQNKTIDISGQRFGRLVVKGFCDCRKGYAWWYCICDCGTEKIMRGHSITNKQNPTKSCGCLKRERDGIWCRKHGMTGSPEYNSWFQMKSRCLNKGAACYKDYGGRGIKVCESWIDSFEAFFKEVGLRPSSKYSLDRINNDGDYEPGNVRWATRSQQISNRRKQRAIENFTDEEMVKEMKRRNVAI